MMESSLFPSSVYRWRIDDGLTIFRGEAHARVVHGSVVHVTHPHYFGLFNPTPTFPARYAGRITAAGCNGFGQHIERSIALFGLISKQSVTHGWLTLNEPLVGALCIIPARSVAFPPIVGQMLVSGKAWVSVIVTEGREVIRARITSELTPAEDTSDLPTALLRADETIHQQERYSWTR